MKILLGISGGIAAYKIPDLIRGFQKKGHQVRVAMTSHSSSFVSPLVLETLSGNRVFQKVLEGDGLTHREGSPVSHIEWIQWADVFLIAPATATTLAKLATGLGEDPVSLCALAFSGPLWVAPSMNPRMLHHPAVQHNLRVLEDRGVRVIAPDSGELACREWGEGRLADPETLVDTVLNGNSPFDSPWKGKRVLLTNGPTRAYLDPVRFITNRSTGRMGLALAGELLRQGAKVAMIHGPLQEPIPDAIEAIPIETTEEMLHETKKRFDQCDVFLSVAAVGDFQPEKTLQEKHKKNSAQKNWDLSLKASPDILKTLAAKKSSHQQIIGFAAETENLRPNTIEKLFGKNLDAVVANPVGEKCGFGDVSTELKIFLKMPNGVLEEYPLGPGTKSELAPHLLEHLGSLMGNNSL